jgi:hypothetical protein
LPQLYGIFHGISQYRRPGAGYENAGRLGALAAAEIIQHIGARPQASRKELAQQNGLPVLGESSC